MSTLDHLALTLTDDLFEQFRQLIYSKTGIYFQDNKRYLLETRLGKRLLELGYPDFKTYFELLSRRNNPQEISTCVNIITINETFFFRAIRQFEILETDILPEIITSRLKQSKNVVRLWSAACSSGEEAYTLALILNERFKARFPQVRFDIVGTDINTEVLARAEEAVYSAYAIRNVPPAYLANYFKKENDQYHLSPEIKKMVRFRRLNLFDRTEMLGMSGIDVVFCANVLIYFDRESKSQAVTSIYNSMNPEGCFFLGYSENLYGIEHGFAPLRMDGIMIYRRES